LQGDSLGIAGVSPAGAAILMGSLRHRLVLGVPLSVECEDELIPWLMEWAGLSCQRISWV